MGIAGLLLGITNSCLGAQRRPIGVHELLFGNSNSCLSFRNSHLGANQLRHRKRRLRHRKRRLRNSNPPDRVRCWQLRVIISELQTFTYRNRHISPETPVKGRQIQLRVLRRNERKHGTSSAAAVSYRHEMAGTGQSAQLFSVATGRNAQFLATVTRSTLVQNTYE